MALTKVTGQVINDTTGLVVGVTTVGGGISATDGFFSGIVTAVGNASFSGNVSVGGTLTYEDVTNIDAVGLVTARNGVVVGSGITLSKDGDIFATGVTTSTTFVGNLTGNVTGNTSGSSGSCTGNSATATDSTNASHVLVTDNESTNENNLITFVEDATSSTGNVGLEMDGNLTYNPSTGTVTATKFVGDGSALTGVGGTDFIHAEQVNVSGIVTAAAFVPTTGQLSHRNIVINGAMTVAQRGTSSAGGEGYKTVDRFQYYKSGTNETPNQAQVDVAAGTTPYTLGFRKAYQVENGNQSSAGGSDLVFIETNLEAQDIANSGWNYLSSSSYITLSFWVKSSVAQNFYGYLITVDGTAYKYPFETGSLSADTWTKVTKTIPGNSNLQFDNDNAKGLGIVWWPFLGTSYTDSGVSLDTWATWSTSTRTPDSTNTWYLTNDATFQITGVQLEVGSAATPFEHRSFGEELRRCQRYCFRLGGSVGGNSEVSTTLAMAVQSHSTYCKTHIQHPVTMRSNDITFTFSDLTVDDDIASYSDSRIQSIDSANSSATDSTLVFVTVSMNNVNVTRILVDTAGGYIQGECEI